MLQLFYSPGACSLAIHVLLNALGQDVTLIDTSISAGLHKSPEFLKINPRGQVPVLLQNGVPVREGMAILLSLTEQFPSPWMPSEGTPERGAALEWLAFCNSTLHPAYSRAFWLMRLPQVSEEVRQLLLDSTVERINDLWQEIEELLHHRRFLAGDTPTVADLLMAVIVNWSPRVSDKIVVGERTRSLIQDLIARPPFQKALLREGVTHYMAS